MEVKRNVRKRRMERIQQLLGRESAEGRGDALPFKPQAQDMPSPASIAPQQSVVPDDPRLQDPEYVWKQKSKSGFGFDHWTGSSSDDDQERDWLQDWLRRFRLRLLICLVLLALVWGLFQLRLPWAEKAQSFVASAVTEPLKFESVATWFEQTFGDAPTFIPTYRQDKPSEAINASTGQKRTYFTPVQGVVSVPFASGGTGIELRTEKGKPVSALDDGQVVAAALSDETGYTVTIRHPNGVESTYGWLELPRVQANDWIKGGETIGYAGAGERQGEGKLYYAIKADKVYVNPADVVSFD